MYKVFIDNKPIVFCTQEELSEKGQHVRYFEGMQLKHVRPFLQGANLDEPVQISAIDPASAFQFFFDGYLKIPAAGGLVRNADNELLLIKRYGMWDIPKGKVDRGENMEIACVREIEEECGIQKPVIARKLTETYHVMRYKERKALKHTYWFVLNYNGDDALVPAKEEGITSVKWKTFEFLLSIRGRTYGSINDVVDSYASLVTEDVL
jgi:8-oxo-dGTP pyrophosphatase MutT (NUDIX family)